MWCLGDSLGQSFSSPEQCLGVEVLLVRRCILGKRRRSDFSEHQGDGESVLSLLKLLQGLQRESKDCEKDHYKNKTQTVSLVLGEVTSTSVSQDTTADKQYLNT